MEIEIRIQEHLSSEIEMGHAISFSGISEKRFVEYGAISATANLNGFVPLTSILRHYKINEQSIAQEVKIANKFNVVRTFKNSQNSPMLILVPQTHGSLKNIEYYISRLIEVCNFHNVKELHFTHYGFVNGVFRYEEIKAILNVLLNPISFIKLEKIIWELDARCVNPFEEVYRNVANKVFRLRKKMPQKYKANNFIEVKSDEFSGVNFSVFQIKSE